MIPRPSNYPLALRWALLLGLTGDLLFRESPPGINVPLWVGTVLLAWLSARSTSRPLTPQQRLLLSLAIGFAATFVLREAPLLRLAGAVGLLACAALSPLAHPDALPVLQVRQVFGAAIGLLRRLLAGFLPSLLEARRAERDSGSMGYLVSAGRGMVLAIPALAIFGSLLASADAGFQHLVERLFHFDPEAFVSHGLLTVFFAWLAAGLVGRPAELSTPAPGQSSGRLGAIETGTLLGLLDLTFLIFVVLQVRYFFGGAALVRSTEGLTYAEYARRGFFELVMVTALVLPLLMWVKAQLTRESVAAIRVYRVSSAALIGLTLVIVASALHRMTIYQREFGLTELRFYASAFIAGLAFSLLWFSATVLRERPGRFVSGGLVSWTTWMFLLVAVNPAGLIARVNLQRAADGRDFDVSYALTLGADAVPSLIAGMDRLPPSLRSQLAVALQRRWGVASISDWRAWTLMDWQARRAARQLVSIQPTTSSP